jgi:hypothetical protein
MRSGETCVWLAKEAKADLQEAGNAQINVVLN